MTVEVPLEVCPRGIWRDGQVTEHPDYSEIGKHCFSYRLLGDEVVVLQVPSKFEVKINVETTDSDCGSST